MISSSYRLEEDNVGSYWLMNSGGSLMLLQADLLLLLLTGLQLLVVVLEAVGGLRLVGLSRLGLLLASLPLLLADLGRLGGRADEGLEVAVLDGLLAVSRHHCEHSLTLTGAVMMVDNSTMTL